MYYYNGESRVKKRNRVVKKGEEEWKNTTIRAGGRERVYIYYIYLNIIFRERKRKIICGGCSAHNHNNNNTRRTFKV